MIHLVNRILMNRQRKGVLDMKEVKGDPVYGEYNYGKKCGEMDCTWHKCKKCYSHDKCRRESMKKTNSQN